MESVNDVHSGLNPTSVKGIHRPTTVEELRRIVSDSAAAGTRLSICGSRHAMGGQQFLTDQALLDMRGLRRILSMDHERGLVTFEAGIDWPALMEGYLALQRERFPDRSPAWGLAQKQTGADSLTLGGAAAANAHGRGLTMIPMIGDIEELELVSPDGGLVRCSRGLRPDLFKCVVGGYGAFGPIATLTLRLAKRRVLRRDVRVIDIEDAPAAARRRIAEGFVYGDFQFDIDPASPDFLTKGVFSGYRPVETSSPPSASKELSREDWMRLLYLAHTDKQAAFSKYAQHYIATDGQTYWSDEHQMGVYLEGYHAEIDRLTGAAVPGSEMISELYVPTQRLGDFLRAAALMLTRNKTEVVYGTIRLIDPDGETVLPWARDRLACIIFNLHVEHSPKGIAAAGESFRGLIDLALERSGSFFLTYHRFARRDQLLKAYPRIPEFLKARDRHDPGGVFSSDWLEWLRGTVADA